MELVAEIRRLAELALSDPGHFIVDVHLSSRKGPKKVLVTIDGDNGVTIDDCAAVSRKVSAALEDAGWMDDAYVLEVSTPGVDLPLRLQRQYGKHVGRKLKVTTGEGTVEGQLVSVTDAVVRLSGSSGTGKQKTSWEKEIPFADIEKAFVLVSFK